MIKLLLGIIIVMGVCVWFVYEYAKGFGGK